MGEISGYRKLSNEEKEMINTAKEWEENLAVFWGQVYNSEIHDDIMPDFAWMDIARDHFAQGFMALNRAIAKPKDVWTGTLMKVENREDQEELPF